MRKIKVEIEKSLLKKIKETWQWTFNAEKERRTRRTIGRKIRSAFLVDDETSPNQIVEIALRDYRDYLRILENFINKPYSK